MITHFQFFDDAQKMQGLIDILPIAIFIKDAESKFLAMNKACEAQWGLNFPDLRGTDASQVFPPEQMKQFLARDREVFMVGSQIDFEETIWNAALGQNRFGHTFKKPIYDASGKPLYLICMTIDITERKQSEKRIIEMATYDGLTGLPNRNLLQDRIMQAIAHDRRSEKQAAVLFIDLDYFKTINDSLGHDMGDLLLQDVAARLSAIVRSEDTVARRGGDEFIVLLPNIGGAQDAEVVAQKILDGLIQPFLIDSRELYIGGSVGIALFPSDGEDVETLLKNSDIAMYHAKENGRNNYQFFTPEMDRRATDRLTLKERFAPRGEAQ